MSFSLARFLLALIPACLAAQSALDRPRLGEMIDRQGLLRPVSGAAGSFLVEAPTAKGVLASACSRALCAAKLKDSILAAGFTAPAPFGPAVIATDGAGAIFYFVETGQFSRVEAGSLTPMDLRTDGEVVSLRSTPAGIDLAVRREDGIRLVSSGGALLDILPASATTAILLPGAVVYATADELVLRREDGSEQTFAAAGVRGLFAMGEEWVEARADSGVYALRTGAGRERLYLLPQSASGKDRPTGEKPQ